MARAALVFGAALACLLHGWIAAAEPVNVPAGDRAQPLNAKAGQPAANKPGAPAVRGNPRPSFQIAPLVQRFSARPGQRLRFSFQVQTLGQPQSLKIKAVGLKQQLNGLVVVDDAVPPSEAVQLSGPLELDLKTDQAATIRGYVDVPRSPAAFHAYGILVTDMGQPLAAGPPPMGEQTGIAVQFVTQYLLRVELEVKGVQQESAKALRIESAQLVDRDGQPVVEADMSNPGDAGVEFQLRCRLLDKEGAQSIAPFGLAMPVRASRPEPLRYESIVFAKSRVQLAAQVPEALFPGEYQLELEWISHGRKCGKTVIPVSVREGDFPAQAAKFAQVAQALRVTPPQIELSHGRGGSRRFPLKVGNHSPRPVNIRLEARNADGTPADWVLLEPSTFVLPAKRDRNVLVTARPAADPTLHRYGSVRVEVNAGEPTAGSHDLPLAVLGAVETVPQVETGPLRWDASGDRPAFVLPIQNQGTVHLPLNGRLSFADASGRRVEISGGFDRWLLPGSQGEIRFPLHLGLPRGSYPVKVQLKVGESEPLSISQQINVE